MKAMLCTCDSEHVFMQKKFKICDYAHVRMVTKRLTWCFGRHREHVYHLRQPGLVAILREVLLESIPIEQDSTSERGTSCARNR